MINFYRYYNRTGLDKEHYGPLIEQITPGYHYTIELKPIEHLITKSPKYARLYALMVIKGRWPEAEPYIMQNAADTLWYAKDVIKGRWPEAEQVIKKDGYWWDEYCREFGI
jgi:hypothetical protein